MKDKIFNRLKEAHLKDKRIFLRADLNVPIVDGHITSTARIDACIPTIRYLVNSGAKVMIASHLGRPSSEQKNLEFSLKPLATIISKKLEENVSFRSDWIDNVSFRDTKVVLLENVRFFPGEVENDPLLSKKMASLCDIYVLDAFGTVHRRHASTYGAGLEAGLTCAGFLIEREVNFLTKVQENPIHPVSAIIGGSKVSTKLDILQKLNSNVEFLIPGGGIANTFLVAAGFNVGKSVFEKNYLETASNLLDGGKIVLPVDVVVGNSTDSSEGKLVSVANVKPDQMILDIGPKTALAIKMIINKSGTIIWNGPLGLFENPVFSGGTLAVAKALGNSEGFTVAGGGDTLSALEQFGVSGLDYVSTGGGAFLEFLEGKRLPALEMLKRKVVN